MRKSSMIVAVLAVALLVTYGYRADSLPWSKTAAKPAAVAKNLWTEDWNTAFVKAKKEQKPVFVDFYTDWCVWCKRLDTDTYSDAGVQKQLRDGWVSIKVNAEDGSKRGTFNGKVMTYPQLQKYFQVQGFPCLLFLDKTGKPAGMIPGYLPAKSFSRALDYYKRELYKKNVDLESYLGGR